MPMQEDNDLIDYPAIPRGGASMFCPSPTGPGGNMRLVNSNEGEVIEASYEDTAVVQVGYAENFSSVQGVFREANL